MTATTPPLVSGYPFVGLVPQLLSNSLATVTDVTRRHGDVVRLRLGPQECYLFAHADHAQEILAEKAKVYTKEGSIWEAAQHLVGRGVGNTDGDFWLTRRRAMQPHFARGQFDGLARIMGDEIRRRLDALADQAKGGRCRVDLFREVRAITSRVFLRAMFSSSIDDKDVEELVLAITHSFASVEKVLWTSFLPSWVPVPGLRRFKEAVAVLDRTVYRILDERLGRPPAENGDLLDLLIAALGVERGDAEGLRGLRDEVATMIVATQDGPSLMVAWSLATMASRPDIAAALRDEATAVVGDGEAALAHCAGLAYTKGVLQEALRLYPPLWLTFRLATADDEVGGCAVPKGALVLLCPYLIQRDERLWPSPEDFDPTRFLRDGGAPDHRGAFVPFGLGSHLCIGKHLGLVFGQLFLAELVRRFTVELAPDARVEAKGAVSLQPRHAVPADLVVVSSK